MAPPKLGGNVGAVLANFRKDQAKAAKVMVEAAKEREDRLKKVQSGGVKKPSGPRQSKSRTKATTTTSSGPGGATLSGSAPPTSTTTPDWKTAVAKPILPLGMRQKQVIDYLRQLESPATAEQIATATGRDISTEPDLANALDANPKIQVEEDAGTFAYLPEANVRNKDQLLDYIRRAGAPVATSEVADAYKAIMDDIAALKAGNEIIGLHSYDPEIGCEVLYAIDQRLKGVGVDEEVGALWGAVEVPEDEEDVGEELKKVGIAPAPRKAPRKKAPGTGKEKKRKQRKQSKLRVVTNAHLMHLLEGDAPATIDTIP